MTRPQPLVVIERRQIIKALKYTNCDVARAAELLDIGKSTLYRRLDEFQIRMERKVAPKAKGAAA